MPDPRLPDAGVPEPIDLACGDPGDLVVSDDLAGLTAAVLAVEHWTEAHARKLDRVLAGKVAVALDARSGAEELRELHELVRRSAGVVQNRAELEAYWEWSVRWRGYASVLDWRLGAVGTLDLDAVLRQGTVQKIMGYLRVSGGFTPVDSLHSEALAPRKSVLRAVAAMVAHRLVEVQDVGGVKMVGLEEYAAAARRMPVLGQEIFVREHLGPGDEWVPTTVVSACVSGRPDEWFFRVKRHPKAHLKLSHEGVIWRREVTA